MSCAGGYEFLCHNKMAENSLPVGSVTDEMDNCVGEPLHQGWTAHGYFLFYNTPALRHSYLFRPSEMPRPSFFLH